MQLVVWYDNKLVKVLSTLPEFSTDWTKADRKIQKSKGKKAVRRNITIDCPEIVEEFNSGKSATDYFNMYVASYHRHFKSKDWSRTVIIWGLEATLVNAMIICNENIENSEIESVKWSNRGFR